LEEQEEE